MDRIEIICSYLDYCKSFADVGCDHGYCAERMLKSGKCETAVVTDVSAKCLSKAEALLSDYIGRGVCRAVCCDGLSGVDEDIGQVLIAGMGGEEIIRILSLGFIPRKFVLQPMSNLPKVRRFLIDSGCKITADNIFKTDKFYFIIKGESSGKESYTESELFFGRDSVKNPVLREWACAELDKRECYLAACERAGADEVRCRKLLNEAALLKEVLK